MPVAGDHAEARGDTKVLHPLLPDRETGLSASSRACFLNSQTKEGEYYFQLIAI